MSKRACHLSFILWGFQWDLNALQTANSSFWGKALALTALQPGLPLVNTARTLFDLYPMEAILPANACINRISACQVAKHWAKETPRGSEFWYVFAHCRPDSPKWSGAYLPVLEMGLVLIGLHARTLAYRSRDLIVLLCVCVCHVRFSQYSELS